jgi:hypothetical protein
MSTEQDDLVRRDKFLIEMYKECSSHLNRHILISWQSVGVVAGALAVFVLGDKVDPKLDARVDYIIGIVVLLCGWLCAHLYDANNWFNRNLLMIANIERQFLRPSDSLEIHFYFTRHRSAKLLKHFRIQWLMTVSLWILLLLYHFHQRIYPGIHSPWDHFEVGRTIPYVVAALCFGYCVYVRKDRRSDYEKLLARSPGKVIE